MWPDGAAVRIFLDSARGRLLETQEHRWVEGRFVPAEQDEDGAQQLVRQGDDGARAAAAHDQGLELGLQGTPGLAGSLGELTEQPPDIAIALRGAARFEPTGGVVVARTEADPRGEAIGAAVGRHVGADLYQQQGRPEAIDAGQGLQQGQGVGFARQRSEQIAIEAGDAGFELLYMGHELPQDHDMGFGQVALHGVEQFLAAGFESPAGEVEHLGGGTAVEQGFDYGARRLAVHVTDPGPQADADVGEHLVQTILLRREHAPEFLPLPGDQAHRAQFGGRHEGGAQQAGTGQGSEPFGIPHIGFTPGDLSDMAGIDHLDPKADGLQGGAGALPVDASAFHDDLVGGQRRAPLGKGAPIPLEGAELSAVDDGFPVRAFDAGAGGNLGLMHIQADHPFEQRFEFHPVTCRNRLEHGRRWQSGPKKPGGGKPPTVDLTCALESSNPEYESVRRVTLGSGVEPPKKCATSSHRRPPLVSFVIKGGASRHAR